MKNLLALAGLVLCLACSQKTYQHHSSMNSLDWAGRYEGTLPGKNGTADPAVLVLKEDLTYSLVRNANQSEGAFAWSPDGGRIVLPEESLHLFVGENFMKAVTRKGKDIEGGKYQMVKKEDLGVLEKYWQLTELNGKAVAVKEGGRVPHLILKDDRAIGNGGCNNFSGSYELNEATGRIRFSKVAATQMACLEDTYEGEFFRVLNEADNFSTDGRTLSLNKARMAPLARFEVMYLK